MAHLNIEKISLTCKDREKEEQKRVFRRKIILVLIHHYLKDYGYIQTADTLNLEVNFNLKEYSVCDNIHLESIIQDFESYYFLKYQKLPQMIKKLPQDNVTNKAATQKHKGNRMNQIFKLTNHSKNNSTEETKSHEKNILKSNLETVGISYKILDESTEHNLEPLGSFENYNKDWRSMAELILQDMQIISKQIKWNDIIGLDRAKELLKEAIVYPLKYQELFSTTFSPWRSMLLYGPSGTGKTLLASAAASESGAVFFKICISTLISKWRGESEKLIKVLFDVAKHYAPSIIFIDEIDALLSHRGEDHEASRRMKTELFLQLDSLFSSNKLVLVLSASNMPWQLDYAILRRLEKRVFIPHPDEESRMHLFKKFLSHSLKITENFEIKMDLNYLELAEVTRNYSASDIEIVCKEAKMNYIRQVIKALEYKSAGGEPVTNLTIEPLTTNNILQIMHKIKPTSSEILSKYEEWQEKHGSE